MRAPRADRSLPDSASFLATLLVRFGEFSSATLDPAKGTLRLVLFLPQALSPAVYRAFRRRVLDALAVLHELERRPAPRVRIRQMRTRHFTRIEVVRELADLMCEELGVVAHLAREMLPLGSPQETWPKEERARQEERLREELEHLRERGSLRPLVGLREEDRIFIYAVEGGRQSTWD
ncbi:MAG: hypothetical protein N0A24_04380 [Armatimonadetes bacterium]|nr:hypothetical protein [Armatimonadota bacterium]MDW8153447.1 hypothetical protein [Armatimonadota bacterium]